MHMVDLPPGPDTGGDAEVEPDDGSPAGTPRWVKVFGLVAVVVIVVLVVAMLAGGGRHGPGRHTDGADEAPLARVIETAAHRPPPDVAERGPQP